MMWEPKLPATETETTETETPAATETTPLPDKAQQAFAQMRIQNKRYSNLLKSVANILGIPETALSDENALTSAVEAKVIEKQAESQNIPAPVLAELIQLRQKEQAMVAQQRNAEVAVGFQRVMDTFKLTPAQLNKFAEELLESGVNPLEQSVDLVKQYKLLHYDELIEKAKQEAIIAEQNRAAKASSQSTTPGSSQGAGSGEPAKVSNVHELNAWLESKTKK